MGREVGVVEQERALGEEQPDRVLHRVDAADEVVLVDEIEKVDDVDARRPGREGQERRPDVDAVRAEQLDRARGIGCGVPFVEAIERLVVQRFERGHHEQASRVAQFG